MRKPLLLRSYMVLLCKKNVRPITQFYSFKSVAYYNDHIHPSTMSIQILRTYKKLHSPESPKAALKLILGKCESN